MNGQDWAWVGFGCFAGAVIICVVIGALIHQRTQRAADKKRQKKKAATTEEMETLANPKRVMEMTGVIEEGAPVVADRDIHAAGTIIRAGDNGEVVQVPGKSEDAVCCVRFENCEVDVQHGQVRPKAFVKTGERQPYYVVGSRIEVHGLIADRHLNGVKGTVAAHKRNTVDSRSGMDHIIVGLKGGPPRLIPYENLVGIPNAVKPGHYEIIGIEGATVRAGENLASSYITRLPQGSIVKVITSSGRRAKIKYRMSTGWVSACTAEGFPILHPVDPTDPRIEYGMDDMSNVSPSKVKGRLSIASHGTRGADEERQPLTIDNVDLEEGNHEPEKGIEAYSYLASSPLQAAPAAAPAARPDRTSQAEPLGSRGATPSTPPPPPPPPARTPTVPAPQSAGTTPPQSKDPARFTINERVEVFYDEGDDADARGWYGAMVVGHSSSDNTYSVVFDTGEECDGILPASIRRALSESRPFTPPDSSLAPSPQAPPRATTANSWGSSPSPPGHIPSTSSKLLTPSVSPPGDPYASAPPLPWCPHGEGCTLLNERTHYSEYRHRCRIEGCGLGGETSHTYYFPHL